MPRRNNFTLKTLLPLFLLIPAIVWIHSDAQVNGGEEANTPPDGHEDDGTAFFALRSCHQLLHGDNGEFFSPDYLCSNPPLWCNWTIQVDPGKRIHLHLEDLASEDACHLKQDQIHVDDPVGHFRGHKVLQKCWQEAKYTSSSNTLHVVLLIGGWPSQQYRGFYGRYQTFGPPVVYHPREGFTERNRKSDPSRQPSDFSDSGSVRDPSPASTVTPDRPLEATDPEAAENYPTNSENYNHVYAVTAVFSVLTPTVPASTPGTSRSERGAAHTPPDQPDPAAPPQQPESLSYHANSSHHTPTATQPSVEELSAFLEDESSRSEEEKLGDGSEPAAEDDEGSEVTEASDLKPEPQEEPEEDELIHPHPNMVEPLLDHRGHLNFRNHSETPHLPGDHLFEVAVEVNLDQEESRKELLRLLNSVKALISQQLRALPVQPSLASKRIKRLKAGVLYIIWLNIGQGPAGQHTYRAVHSTLQGLVGMGVNGNPKETVILSVSTGDVNECGTHLMLCDINADCVNNFGTYLCRCRPGYQDESRLGSGGTVCVDVKSRGCTSAASAETKGIYVLFFLLSSLILMLLAAACTLYHRHHRGAFLVRCHSNTTISPSDPNNNNHRYRDDRYTSHVDADLPPPPLPVRGPRESWPSGKERCPAVDLPLLRFSPLPPPDGYLESQEGGKM